MVRSSMALADGRVPLRPSFRCPLIGCVALRLADIDTKESRFPPTWRTGYYMAASIVTDAAAASGPR